MRNIGTDYVKTERFFFDDVDLEPAKGLYKTLKATLAAERARIGDTYFSTVVKIRYQSFFLSFNAFI